MNESPCKYLWTMYIQYLYNEEQADSISVLEHFASSSERDTSLSSGYECSVLLCVCLRWERAGGCILFRTGVEQLRILAMICMQTTKHHDYYTRSARHPRKKITKASPLRVCRLHVNKQTSGRAKNIEPNNALTFMAGRLYIPGWLRLMEAWSAAAAQCITYLNRLQFAHRRAMYMYAPCLLLSRRRRGLINGKFAASWKNKRYSLGLLPWCLLAFGSIAKNGEFYSSVFVHQRDLGWKKVGLLWPRSILLTLWRSKILLRGSF